MTQENLTFYTLTTPVRSVPLKQRIYLFSQSDSPEHKKVRNPQRSTRRSKKSPELDLQSELHTIWKPRIPSKKLFEDPRFFLSLERKKFRIINGIKNMSMLGERQPCESILKGKKVKEGTFSLRKINSIQPQLTVPQCERKGWEPNNRTPYLNFNMQYLIKKRKSMTPTLYHGLEKLSKTVSSHFN